MFPRWFLFLLVVFYGVYLSSAVGIQPAVHEVSNLRYPTSKRHSRGLGALIIPGEIQSAIQTLTQLIKKGTDSRLGFGFAFGNHADFQVILELGPQTYTKVLDGTGFNATPPNPKRQALSKPNITKPKITKSKEKLMQTVASKYLENWAKKIKNSRLLESDSPQPGIPNLEEPTGELTKSDEAEYKSHQPRNKNMSLKILEEWMKTIRQV